MTILYELIQSGLVFDFLILMRYYPSEVLFNGITIFWANYFPDNYTGGHRKYRA